MQEKTAQPNAAGLDTLLPTLQTMSGPLLLSHQPWTAPDCHVNVTAADAPQTIEAATDAVAWGSG